MHSMTVRLPLIIVTSLNHHFLMTEYVLGALLAM